MSLCNLLMSYEDIPLDDNGGMDFPQVRSRRYDRVSAEAKIAGQKRVRDEGSLHFPHFELESSVLGDF